MVPFPQRDKFILEKNTKKDGYLEYGKFSER